MDYLVKLYDLPSFSPPEGLVIKRALAPDLEKILTFVRNNFGEGWMGEARVSLFSVPANCFIAQQQGELVGFACVDATARGFFGPIGVRADQRGKGVGRTLLLRSLAAMREMGYGYAVIGWADGAAGFYQKAVQAIPIPDSFPGVYGNLIHQ